MQNARSLSAVIALMLFTGCSTTTDSESPVVGSANTAFSTTIHVTAEDLQGYELDKLVLAEVHHEAGDAIKSLVDRYGEGDITAEELDEMAGQIVSDYAQDRVLRKTVSSLVSHTTLNALLENGDTRDIKPYIARHTEVLVEYNSPHAEDISRALKALDGYWTEAKIETFAEKAVAAAEDYLGRSVVHATDKAEEHNPANDVPVKQLHESKAKMNAGISSGVQSLEQILEE